MFSDAPTGTAPAPSPALPAIDVCQLGKCYRIYARPQDRLKQALVRGRRQYFREFWALRDVSLSIHRGETVGIMGRNGCGKSTLLQLISQTLQPSTGQVQIRGRIAALLELGAGFNPDFSGRDNVYINAAILGLPRAEIDARFREIVAFAELEDFIDQPVKTYSSGMYVRLAFAVAVSVDPDILVVDEALAVGDEAFQRKCYRRIEEIQHRGGTILFVSHAASAIVELCDRAVLLDQGELLLTGEPKAVVMRYHQLLYTPAEKTAEIRAQIRGLRSTPATGGPPSQVHATAAETSAAASSPRPAGLGPRGPSRVLATDPPSEDGPDAPQAGFDPHLLPKSTVAYASGGAWISHPQITTLDGRPVNLLVPQHDYHLRYRVRFDDAAYQVRFGTLLKTPLGVEISGMAYPDVRNQAIPVVERGTEVEVAFRFRCWLASGVYFANVGLMGVVGQRSVFLHRLEDALMFRVQQVNQQTSAGMVDLFLESQVQFSLPSITEWAA